MGRRMYGWVGWMAALAIVGASGVATGKTLIEFRVEQDGKVAGRYDMGVVRNEGGTFVVGNFYPGAKALTGRRRGTPQHRLYGELDLAGTLGKYKRWVTRGVDQEYWMVFLFKGEVKLRHEKVEGGSGQVTVLGKVPGVVPMDPGMPALAWALLGATPAEREVPCAGTTPGAFGTARVVSAGTETVARDEGEPLTLTHWKVEGDCGAVDLFLDEEGVPQRMLVGDRQYERFTRK